MKILHVMPARFPIQLYGGAERAAYNLAKGLAELGHENYFLCLEGSEIPFAKVIPWDFSNDWQNAVPDGIDIVQVYNTPNRKPNFPYLVCIQGNGRPGERFHGNTIFLSANHAKRHNWSEYVFNGIDPAEYPLGKHKNPGQLLFLAKASWPIKNLYGAMDLSVQSGCRLEVCGGKGSLYYKIFRPYVHFNGMVGGEKKIKILQESEALLFPVLWHEPFGIAVIEAMATGAPVFASNRGSLPELIDGSSGAICNTREEFIVAISRRHQWTPEQCRARVLNNFTHRHQAERYLEKYKKILSQGQLREGQAFCSEDFISEEIKLIPRLRSTWKIDYKLLKQKEAKIIARRKREDLRRLKPA